MLIDSGPQRALLLPLTPCVTRDDHRMLSLDCLRIVLHMSLCTSRRCTPAAIRELEAYASHSRKTSGRALPCFNLWNPSLVQRCGELRRRRVAVCGICQGAGARAWHAGPGGHSWRLHALTLVSPVTIHAVSLPRIRAQSSRDFCCPSPRPNMGLSARILATLKIEYFRLRGRVRDERGDARDVSKGVARITFTQGWLWLSGSLAAGAGVLAT